MKYCVVRNFARYGVSSSLLGDYFLLTIFNCDSKNRLDGAHPRVQRGGAELSMSTTSIVVAEGRGTGSERRLGTIGNEDWWAVVVGLAIVILGLIDYALGTGVIKFLGVSPAGMKWATAGDIAEIGRAHV